MRRKTARYLVILDDYKTNLSLYKAIFQPMADRDEILIRSFYDDRDAAEFFAANSGSIVGLIQDINRPTVEARYRPAGLHFLDGIVRLLTPHARVAIISAAAGSRECERLMLDPQILVIQKPALSSHIEQAYVWCVSQAEGGIQPDKDFSKRSTIITAVSLPWEDIKKCISRDPTLLHRMPARRFEELVAEIYKDYGWEVELTAQVRDGGFDIIALRRDMPTQLKVLIEAKRYSPDRAVGVGIIRSLYATRCIHRASQVVLATSSHVSADARKEFVSSIPHELSFMERDAILEWCRQTTGQVIGGFELG